MTACQRAGCLADFSIAALDERDVVKASQSFRVAR